MKYYLGNYQKSDEWPGIACWVWPAGVVGAIDLGTPARNRSSLTERPGGFFWTPDDVALPSEYELVGTGDCRELSGSDSKILSAFESLIGYRPQGDRLSDLIYDCLLGGGDPDGQVGPHPLVPDSRRLLKLCMPGHGRVKTESFRWGQHSHTDKLKTILRRHFSEYMEAAQRGELKDAQHHRRILDAWCEQYNLSGDNWKELVPAALQKDVSGRLQHETSYSDDFNRATLNGGSLTWTAIESGWSIDSSIRLEADSVSSNWGVLRNDGDLSSSNHYCEAVFNTGGAGGNAGIAARKDSSTTRSYYCAIHRTSTGNIETFVFDNNSAAQIAAGGAYSGTPTIRLICNGSTISATRNGSADVAETTNTVISSGTRTGFNNANTAVLFDDYNAADLGGDSFTATAAVTIGAVTADGSASYASSSSGTAAVNVGAATAAGTANYLSVSTGTAAVAVGAATAAGAATYLSVSTGTAAVSIAAVTASGVVTFTAPVYEGEAAVIIGAATCDGEADFSTEITATAAVTIGAATADGSATYTSVSEGTAAVNVGAATAAGTATFSAPVYEGTAAVSIGPVAASGVGTFGVTVSGSASVVVAAATCEGLASFFETVPIPPITLRSIASQIYCSGSVAAAVYQSRSAAAKVI